MFTTLIQVALGGAIGASARYVLSLAVAFPIGTLAVNVIGSFLMGLAFVGLSEKGLDRFSPLLMTGILGGFTTFSAFSLDAWKLFEMGRTSAAAGYVLASVGLSIAALVAGIVLMKAAQV